MSFDVARFYRLARGNGEELPESEATDLASGRTRVERLVNTIVSSSNGLQPTTSGWPPTY